MDNTLLTLPIMPPALIISRRLPIAPRISATVTLVSDSHLVPSHAVAPSLDRLV